MIVPGFHDFSIGRHFVSHLVFDRFIVNGSFAIIMVTRITVSVAVVIAVIASEAIITVIRSSSGFLVIINGSLAIVVTLGHWVKALGDGIQTRAGAEGDSGIGIASMAKTRVAIAQTRVASIAESTIAIASIRISSIAKLSLSIGSGNKGRNNLKKYLDLIGA